jgi:hypothetical protein
MEKLLTFDIIKIGKTKSRITTARVITSSVPSRNPCGTESC